MMLPLSRVIAISVLSCLVCYHQTLAVRISVEIGDEAVDRSGAKDCSEAVVANCLEVSGDGDVIDAARATVLLGMEAIPQEVDSFFSEFLGDTRFSCASMCQKMSDVGSQLLGVTIPSEPEVLCLDPSCRKHGGNEILTAADEDSGGLQELEDNERSAQADDPLHVRKPETNTLLPLDASQQVLEEVGHSHMAKVICRRLLSTVFRLFPSPETASEGQPSPALLEQFFSARRPPVDQPSASLLEEEGPMLRGFESFQAQKADLLITLQRAVRATSAASRLLSRRLPTMNRAECERHFPLYITSDEPAFGLSEEQGTACLVTLWLHFSGEQAVRPYRVPPNDEFHPVFDDLRGLRSHVASIEAILADPIVVFAPQSPSRTIRSQLRTICGDPGSKVAAAVIPGMGAGNLTSPKSNYHVKPFQPTDTKEGNHYKIFLCPHSMTLDLHRTMTMDYIHEASHHFGTWDKEGQDGKSLYPEGNALRAGQTWISRANAQNIALVIMRLAHWEGLRHEPIVSPAEARLEPFACAEWGKKCGEAKTAVITKDGKKWLLGSVCSECRPGARKNWPTPSDAKNMAGSKLKPQGASCPPNMQMNQTTRKCNCNPGTVLSADGTGCTVWQPQCPPNAHMNPTTKQCDCDSGTVLTADGTGCTHVEKRGPQCPPNAHMNPTTKQCNCDPGTVLTPDATGCTAEQKGGAPQPPSKPSGPHSQPQWQLGKDQAYCGMFAAQLHIMCRQATVLKDCSKACAKLGVK